MNCDDWKPTAYPPGDEFDIDSLSNDDNRWVVCLILLIALMILLILREYEII